MSCVNNSEGSLKMRRIEKILNWLNDEQEGGGGGRQEDVVKLKSDTLLICPRFCVEIFVMVLLPRWGSLG